MRHLLHLPQCSYGHAMYKKKWTTTCKWPSIIFYNVRSFGPLKNIKSYRKQGHLKKIAPSGGRRENFWGISCEKSRFYAEKSYFFQLPREARKFWGISCEKSRFYAKIIFFFNFTGGRENFGVFRVKNHDFTPKIFFFSHFRGGAPLPPWIRPWNGSVIVHTQSTQLITHLFVVQR